MKYLIGSYGQVNGSLRWILTVVLQITGRQYGVMCLKEAQRDQRLV